MPYAEQAWRRTDAALEGYAQDWVTMHTEACEATTVRGEQSPQQMDLRMRCLHRAAVELRSTVDVLADADATVVQKAHELARVQWKVASGAKDRARARSLAEAALDAYRTAGDAHRDDVDGVRAWLAAHPGD